MYMRTDIFQCFGSDVEYAVMFAKADIYFYPSLQTNSHLNVKLTVFVDIAKFSIAKRLLAEIYGKTLEYRLRGQPYRCRYTLQLEKNFI